LVDGGGLGGSRAGGRRRTFALRKAHEDGFDLDAHVSVSAGARQELERLVRYILRPPLKEARLSVNADGVELTLKQPWSDGTT